MKKPAGLFSKRLVDLALSIKPGTVTTYGALAKAAGGGGQAARSVSSILSKSEFAKSIPFHRIVYSGGVVYSGKSCGVSLHAELLRKEGLKISEKGRIANFEEFFEDFR